MLRRARLAGILVLMFAAAAWAADATGRWQGSITGPNGDIQITFNFKVDGAKLTGTVESPNGDIPIEDGKVDGDHIYFVTHFGGNEVKHNGTVSADSIQLKVEGPWGESDMSLKRANAEKKPSGS